MWKYVQSSGALVAPDGTVFHRGYSGADQGRNNPDMQCVKNVGPIPRGWYEIKAPVDYTKKKYVMNLTPAASTDTCGRGGFQIHGDNQTSTASTGCIIVSPKRQRELIWASGDRKLRVVRDSNEVTIARLNRAPSTSPA
jgi:hypothetical protein